MTRLKSNYNNTNWGNFSHILGEIFPTKRRKFHKIIKSCIIKQQCKTSAKYCYWRHLHLHIRVHFKAAFVHLHAEHSFVHEHLISVLNTFFARGVVYPNRDKFSILHHPPMQFQVGYWHFRYVRSIPYAGLVGASFKKSIADISTELPCLVTSKIQEIIKIFKTQSSEPPSTSCIESWPGFSK